MSSLKKCVNVINTTIIHSFKSWSTLSFFFILSGTFFWDIIMLYIIQKYYEQFICLKKSKASKFYILEERNTFNNTTFFYYKYNYKTLFSLSLRLQILSFITYSQSFPRVRNTYVSSQEIPAWVNDRSWKTRRSPSVRAEGRPARPRDEDRQRLERGMEASSIIIDEADRA